MIETGKTLKKFHILNVLGSSESKRMKQAPQPLAIRYPAVRYNTHKRQRQRTKKR